MLFNSLEFLYFFLPASFLGFQILRRYRQGAFALFFLGFCSLFFYGWWSPAYLILLLISIIANFSLGRAISRSYSKVILTVAVIGNLTFIGWFKYANFFVGNLNWVTNTDISLPDIILPLGISFFTFQQIAYLVDCYKHKVEEHSFLHYLVFVSFFPQLIAGPIVHHGEMIPQLVNRIREKQNWTLVALGLTLFGIGLFKKVILADNLAVYVSPIFEAADAGHAASLLEAWAGALGYTLQLYFDFSGYSDMAIGLGYLFGVELPVNFFSPYKAGSIIEFWRRWHMTLSQFLRDYLYIPLGGNRKGKARRHLNLMITMLLGGLWHGAGWNFVIWGGLHGGYLIINHLWSAIFPTASANRAYTLACHTVTLLAVITAWVVFRAETLAGALNILQGMAGMSGTILPQSLAGTAFLFNDAIIAESKAIGALSSMSAFTTIGIGFLVVFLFPNCAEIRAWILGQGEKHAFSWQLNKRWLGVATITLCASLYAVTYYANRVSEFIYFQF
ncbi:MBOAT family O-acyltransferase [Aestuariispira ectoiniformans]|uniref:MBOAT family O-acyltransferase n=1 Tax=Aestuariispira ectoiniformans TaxID=2775080 RepID=UPI00223C0661|nr:MBOAT family O-acyltransferase [Aestuariispira ectoiniformans]